MGSDQTRSYARSESVVFLKTNEAFGGLSNMAGGFPLHVNGLRIFTSEALYQACRFPHRPEVQRLIIGQASPMTAKMKSKPYRHDSRPDWDQVRVKIMRWSLRVKLAQNWVKFSDLLLATGDRPIVEESRKDDFWGAKSIDEHTLVGTNVLGRLLMELREAVKNDEHDSLLRVEPLAIPDFLLDGHAIQTVSVHGVERRAPILPTTERREQVVIATTDATQHSLFEQPAVKEAPAPYTASNNAQVAIGELGPYPAMKNSGMPWLGEVPGHWGLERAKWLFRKMDRPVRDADQVVTCFRDGIVTLRANRRVRGFTESLKEIGYQGIRRGDLVIHAMDAFAGAVGVADSDGKGTPVYSVCQPQHNTNAHFYAFLVREMARSQWIVALAKGIRERSTDFRFDGFASQDVPVPPPSEQTAIVRFLEHADRRIRRHIGAKRKLIKLLEEQKQAIIHRAVTRGLDPNVRLKPSGVEWLGDVPEHWDVVRLKTLVAGVTSGSRGWSNFEADYGPLFIRIGNLTRASLNLDFSDVVRLRLPTAALSEGARTKVQANDILLSITAYIGSVAVVPERIEDAYVSQHVACCRPRNGAANARWVGYVLLSPVGQIHGQLCMYGGTKQGLSLDDVKNHVVLLPSRNEQDALVKWIESESEDVDSTMTSVYREISLLREYRTRLIADVVTGKVDVRAAAANLPDEADEPGASDDTDALAEGDEPADGDLDTAPEETEA